MSTEPISQGSPEKNLDQAKVKDKTLHGEEIKTAHGNATQALIKRREGLTSYKLTKDGQQPLILVDENKQEHKDTRPLRKHEPELEHLKHERPAQKSLADYVGLPGAIDTLKWVPKTNQAASNDFQTTSEKVIPVGMSVESHQEKLKANDQVAPHKSEGREPHSDKILQRSRDTSEINEQRKAPTAPSEHQWEEKRRQQLIAEYKADAQKNPETLANSVINETKGKVDETVKKMEVDRQKELESEYEKKGMTPEQASDAAKIEIQNTHDQLVSRINEQVQHFEFIQRQQLETLKVDRPLMHAELAVRDHEDKLVADIARMETSRRHELEQNRLTGKETPEQIQKIKQDVDNEIKNAYSQMYDLMQKECTWKPGMNRQQKQDLAFEGLHQISDTTDIQQGNHESCNAATVEATVSSRHPAEAARMLKEVALTGAYTIGGHTYSMPHENLAFHHEADNFYRSPRTFASQIIETTIVNLYFAKNPKEEKTYFETDKIDTNRDSNGRYIDTGERIEDKKGKKFLKGATGAFAEPGHFMRIQNLITGEKGTVLTTVPRDSDSFERPGVDKVTHKPNLTTVEVVKPVTSVDDLKERLRKANANHEFPITVEVNISLFDGAGGSSSHVMTIRGYDDSDRNNPKIYIDNQYNRSKDHLQGFDSEHNDTLEPLTPEKLYADMQFPGYSKLSAPTIAKPKQVNHTGT